MQCRPVVARKPAMVALLLSAMDWAHSSSRDDSSSEGLWMSGPGAAEAGRWFSRKCCKRHSYNWQHPPEWRLQPRPSTFLLALAAAPSRFLPQVVWAGCKVKLSLLNQGKTKQHRPLSRHGKEKDRRLESCRVVHSSCFTVAIRSGS
jgi:hypothetical protein